MKFNVIRLKTLIKGSGKTYEQVGRAAGINRDTFTRRLKSGGGDFKVSEIYAMANFIPLSKKELLEVFSSKKIQGMARYPV